MGGAGIEFSITPNKILCFITDKKYIQFSNVHQMCDPMRLNSPHYLTPLKKKRLIFLEKINADCFTKLQKIRNEENLRKRHARPKEDGD